MADPLPPPHLLAPPGPAPDAPPGPLVIRGGGVVGVSTDALLAVGARLAALAATLTDLAHRVAATPSVVSAGRLLVPASARLGPGGDVDAQAGRLAAQLRQTAEGASELRARMHRAARDYEHAEQSANWAAEARGALIGYSLGAAWPVLLALALSGGAGAWIGWHLAPGSDARKGRAVQRFLLAHPELVTSPQFVAFVRGFASSVDDAVLGAAGVPRPMAWILGGNGSGAGVEVGGTAVLAAGGAAGLFRETDVRVRRVSEAPISAPPATLSDRFARIPKDVDGPDPQVRVERYAAPGARTRWVVYVDPTETFSPKQTGEPWDLTSNVDGVAARTGASFRATEAAMHDAGIAPTDPVQFVGFSQGGLVAGMLAGSGEWNAAGLDTFAAPIGNIPLPDDLPGMNVRHTDDFVPALAGPDLPSERMLVEQQAFPGGGPPGIAAPAHQAAGYAATAADIDASSSPEMRAQLEAMRRFTADQAALRGATMTEYVYRAERVGPERMAFLEPMAPRTGG